MGALVMRGVSWLSAGLVASSLVLGSAAMAQTAGAQAGAVNQQSKAKAREHYMAGQAAYKAGQWQKAYDEFLAAWNLGPHPQTAAVLGLAAAKLGKHRDATEHLSYAVRHGGTLTDEDRKVLAESRAKVGEVTVQVNVEKARVLVNGRPVGESPFSEPLYVDPGNVVIDASRDGYTAGRKSFDVTPGGAYPIQLTLVAAESSGSDSQPDHQPGAKDPINWRLWGGILGGAASVAGITVGAVFTVKANHASDDVQERRQVLLDTRADKSRDDACAPNYPSRNAQGCADLKSAAKTKDNHHNTAVVAYAIGGTLAVGTVAFVLFGPDRSRHSGGSAQVSPVVSPWFQGLQLAGSF